MTTSISRLFVSFICAASLTVVSAFAGPVDRPDSPPIEGFYPMQKMFFLKKMKPDAKRIGVIWKRGVAKQKEKLQSLQRAVASIQGKIFLAYVEQESDIGKQFRELTRKHDVHAIWVVENDGVVDAATPRKFLIENSLKQGIPLLAPSEDWVSAGAPLTVTKVDGEFQILLNKPAASATSLTLPAEYESVTKLIAAN